MAVDVAKVDVWFGQIEDRSGGLSEKIEAVTEAGANLEFVIARRTSKPGTGLVFMAPIRGGAETEAAKAAGLAQAPDVHTLRLEGPNDSGFGAAITRAVAGANINMRGLSGTGLGQRCTIYLSFDTNADADKARRILEETFASI